jgi:hypothetical protein
VEDWAKICRLRRVPPAVDHPTAANTLIAMDQQTGLRHRDDASLESGHVAKSRSIVCVESVAALRPMLRLSGPWWRAGRSRRSSGIRSCRHARKQYSRRINAGSHIQRQRL